MLGFWVISVVVSCDCYIIFPLWSRETKLFDRILVYRQKDLVLANPLSDTIGSDIQRSKVKKTYHLFKINMQIFLDWGRFLCRFISVIGLCIH